jgi:hypothetical protein
MPEVGHRALRRRGVRGRLRAASAEMALSKASGPSSTAPAICPRSAILHSAAASSVEPSREVTVSTADSSATRGCATPSAWATPIFLAALVAHAAVHGDVAGARVLVRHGGADGERVTHEHTFFSFVPLLAWKYPPWMKLATLFRVSSPMRTRMLHALHADDLTLLGAKANGEDLHAPVGRHLGRLHRLGAGWCSGRRCAE